MRAEKITLQTILQLGYAAYERKHRLPDYVRRAVWAILACRTAVLGGHVQACPEGHVERIWDHSCRHRMCPPCAWVQVERWLTKQKGRLLACEHYHVIFTLPHELNDLWLANVGAMTQLLFASVHETLVELLGDSKISGGDARHPRDAAHLEPDTAAASAPALSRDWGWLERGRPVGGGAQRVFAAHASGHGGVPG